MRVNGRELSNDEMDRRLGRQYRKIHALHQSGGCDHPGTIPVSKWPATLRGTHAAAADDESEISPDNVSGQDSASRGSISMSQAFPGFDRVGLKFPIPPRK